MPVSPSFSTSLPGRTQPILRVDQPHAESQPTVSLAEAYGQLVQATITRMEAVAAQVVQVPEQYAKRSSTGNKFQLVAYAFDLCSATQPMAQLRLVRIDGARSNIVNAWIFPTDPSQLPVFAAELIGVSDVTRVAFVDVQVPALATSVVSQVAATTRALAQQFHQLPCDETAPDWATCQSAGFFTYARDAGKSHQEMICDCYLTYLDYYLGLLGSRGASRQSSDCTAALGQLHDYQMHHMEHSPGKKFLSNLFGADWTESFMLNFLFSRPPVGQNQGMDV